MRCFFDTSVLVSACLRKHPHFNRARPLLEDVVAGKTVGVISAHSVAETFSALTSVPLTPRIQPLEARQILDTNIIPHFEQVPVSAPMYERAVRICVEQGLGGGRVYDALLLECARHTKVDRIYTFNLQDFRRLAPDWADRIMAP